MKVNHFEIDYVLWILPLFNFRQLKAILDPKAAAIIMEIYEYKLYKKADNKFCENVTHTPIH